MSEKQIKIKRKAPKTAFKPGQSGNPAGRPKSGRAISDILNQLLEVPIGDITTREVILEKVIKMAIDGDKWANEFIADRTEGKALERIEQKIEMDEVVIK